MCYFTHRIHKLHVEPITELFDPVGDFVKMNFLSSSICQQILTNVFDNFTNKRNTSSNTEQLHTMLLVSLSDIGFMDYLYKQVFGMFYLVYISCKNLLELQFTLVLYRHLCE